MEPEKNTTPPESEQPTGAEEPQAPVDALSRTPEDLEEEKAERVAVNNEAHPGDANAGEKKISPIRRFFRRVNVYLLLFLLLGVVAGAFTLVSYLNSQKTTPQPSIASQNLTTSALKQLANTDATVGSASQTLTIQGNAVIAGQTLARGNLNVAGNFQTGGSIQAPNLTISGTSNLGTTQINTLQVASNTAIQGSTTLRDLSVAGSATFSGAVTVSQLTVSQLTVSGNGILNVPNHIAFTGPTPGRSFTNPGVLGNGGSFTITGSDATGTISVNTGNEPTGTGCFAHITFHQAFTNQPHVIISPVGAGAGSSQYYVNRTTTGFDLCFATKPITNAQFAFDYFIAG